MSNMAPPSGAIPNVLPTPDAAAGGEVEGFEPPGRWRLILRRFTRNRMSLFGLIVLAVMFLMAFVGIHLSPWSYDQPDYTAFLQAPSLSHWFGTNQAGEDLFAQTMRGMQKSLIIGLLVGVVSTALAAIVGSCAGYFGGFTDRLLMWLVDLMLVVPSFLFIATLSPHFRSWSWIILVILLALFSWLITSRIVRSMTLTLKNREFVLAARYMGVPVPLIILRHILPNISSLLIIDATITVGSAILGETGLSFFGFGVQPPDVSLGTVIAGGTEGAVTYPWLFLFPAAALVLIVLCVNFIGDGLRDALDPGATGARAQ